MKIYKNNSIANDKYPLSSNIKAEAIKVSDTQIAKILFILIVCLTFLMVMSVSLFRFETQESWLDSLNGIASPSITLLAVPFILLICEEWTYGTALITYTFTPNRSKVILSKLIVLVGVFLLTAIFLSILTYSSAAISSVIYSHPVDLTINVVKTASILMPLLVNMLLGFSMALIAKDTTVAIALYFIIPPVTVIAEQIPSLSEYAKWFSLGHSSSIFIAGVSEKSFAQYVSSFFIWIVVPSIIGIILNKKRDVD